MNLTLGDLEALPLSELRGSRLRPGQRFTGVTTDSRQVAPGNLFIALRGGRFDGHAFVVDAIARGARGIVVESSYHLPAEPTVPHLLVENTTTALGDLALAYRRKFSIPVLAVGGSNGKTTTKDMIAGVLGSRYSVLSTAGNLNNHIGVPQTLFRLRASHEVAVVEIGTNHPGEIRYLCGILEPTHGLVTTIGREHLEFFKTVAGVAREEGALYEALAGRGVGFVNADDERVMAIGRAAKRRILYGVRSTGARVRGAVGAAGGVSMSFWKRGSARRAQVRLQVPGEHNALNALAAAAVGLEFGVPVPSIVRALERFRPSSKRMEVIRIGGMTVLNDTYNANPDSTIAALRTLASLGGRGKRIAVLADMLELGKAGPAEHARVGREASKLRIDHLLTFGTLAKEASRASGLPGAVHYDQKNMLAEYLVELAGPGDVILVKGSRGMAMEDVVTFFTERHQRHPASA